MQIIGNIESCYKDKFGVPRQPGLVKDSWAKLKVLTDFQPQDALQGLEGFSHIWLIWQFHQNTNNRFHAKVHPPRAEGKTIGVFATRSPHRPNPIGLSLVKLEKIEDNVLYLSGVDLVDGTPVYDIKPYLPEIESIPGAQVGWTSSAIKKEITVKFSPQARIEIEKWQLKNPAKKLEQLIIDSLQLDPRPLVYKGFEGQSKAPYRQIHAMRIAELDIHFEYTSENTCVVNEIGVFSLNSSMNN